MQLAGCRSVRGRLTLHIDIMSNIVLTSCPCCHQSVPETEGCCGWRRPSAQWTYIIKLSEASRWRRPNSYTQLHWQRKRASFLVPVKPSVDELWQGYKWSDTARRTDVLLNCECETEILFDVWSDACTDKLCRRTILCAVDERREIVNTGQT